MLISFCHQTYQLGMITKLTLRHLFRYTALPCINVPTFYYFLVCAVCTPFSELKYLSDMSKKKEIPPTTTNQLHY